jgi:hypothetical protein
MNWISNNISFMTLIVTALLAIITLLYTLITRRMLRLASQPTITIRSKNVSITPDIPDTAIIHGNEDSLGKERYCVAFEIDLKNIGNQPAQNIYIDAEVHFKVNRPLGNKALPVHLPEFISFLAPQSNDDKTASVFARFDNFVARELIRDFFEGRRNMEGSPFLPSRDEMGNPKLWPSPKVILRCFYSDIQGHNYISELQLFFHIWKDSKHKKMDIYLLNMQELEFVGIKQVSKRFREHYIKKNRHKRYMSFDGEKYSKKDLLLLVAKRRKQEKKEGDVLK